MFRYDLKQSIKSLTAASAPCLAAHQLRYVHVAVTFASVCLPRRVSACLAALHAVM